MLTPRPDRSVERADNDFLDGFQLSSPDTRSTRITRAIGTTTMTAATTASSVRVNPSSSSTLPNQTDPASRVASNSNARRFVLEIPMCP
ncbi:hypothetical protein D8S78_21950 [Natrialba swarupiae]|nr:hypothetical protein [Natrialba swarupiae]